MIPKLDKTDTFDNYINTDDENCYELELEETINDILYGLMKLEREIMSKFNCQNKKIRN